MIILGLDPGLAILGYEVIEVLPGKKMRAVDYGCVFTEAHTPLPDRLMKISDGIAMLFETYRPDAVSMEELFFAKNVKTGIMVAQARGVALEGCARRTKELYEYTPLQVKQAVVGYGRAEKQQVQFMVKTLLQLREIPKPDDAADALAIAICHAQSAICNSAMRRR